MLLFLIVSYISYR